MLGIWDCGDSSAPIAGMHAQARLGFWVFWGLAGRRAVAAVAPGGWRPAWPTRARANRVAWPTFLSYAEGWCLKSALADDRHWPAARSTFFQMLGWHASGRV